MKKNSLFVKIVAAVLAGLMLASVTFMAISLLLH